MNSLKTKIIEKIINLLKMNNVSDKEIQKLKTELENNNIKNLIKLINNNFQEVTISKEINQFIKSLVKSKIFDENYLLKINNISYVNFKEKDNFYFSSSRPLQLKNTYLSQIKNFKELTSINHNKISKEEYLRKKIIESRTSYLEDPTKFITSLQEMDAENIYKTFADSHDITLIQHCISKLNYETLNRLLVYVEEKINLNHYDVMSIFIEEAIKRNLHNKKIA